MMMYQTLYIAPNLQFTVYISVPDELREPSGTDDNDVFGDGQDDDDDDDDDKVIMMMIMNDDGNDEDGNDADEYDDDGGKDDNDYDDDVVEDDGDRQCMDTTDLYLVSRKSQKG